MREVRPYMAAFGERWSAAAGDSHLWPCPDHTLPGIRADRGVFCTTRREDSGWGSLGSQPCPAAGPAEQRRGLWQKLPADPTEPR